MYKLFFVIFGLNYCAAPLAQEISINAVESILEQKLISYPSHAKLLESANRWKKYRLAQPNSLLQSNMSKKNINPLMVYTPNQDDLRLLESVDKLLWTPQIVSAADTMSTLIQKRNIRETDQTYNLIMSMNPQLVNPNKIGAGTFLLLPKFMVDRFAIFNVETLQQKVQLKLAENELTKVINNISKRSNVDGNLKQKMSEYKILVGNYERDPLVPDFVLNEISSDAASVQPILKSYNEGSNQEENKTRLEELLASNIDRAKSYWNGRITSVRISIRASNIKYSIDSPTIAHYADLFRYLQGHKYSLGQMEIEDQQIGLAKDVVFWATQNNVNVTCAITLNQDQFKLNEVTKIQLFNKGGNSCPN